MTLAARRAALRHRRLRADLAPRRLRRGDARRHRGQRPRRPDRRPCRRRQLSCEPARRHGERRRNRRGGSLRLPPRPPRHRHGRHLHRRARHRPEEDRLYGGRARARRRSTSCAASRRPSIRRTCSIRARCSRCDGADDVGRPFFRSDPTSFHRQPGRNRDPHRARRVGTGDHRGRRLRSGRRAGAACRAGRRGRRPFRRRRPRLPRHRRADRRSDCSRLRRRPSRLRFLKRERRLRPSLGRSRPRLCRSVAGNPGALRRQGAGADAGQEPRRAPRSRARIGRRASKRRRPSSPRWDRAPRSCSRPYRAAAAAACASSTIRRSSKTLTRAADRKR